MKTLERQIANMVVQYIKPAVEKYKIPVDSFDITIVQMFAYGIVTDLVTTQQFKNWIGHIVSKNTT